MRCDWFAISEQGGDPAGNQDYALVDPDGSVFIIADGMGGRPGGAQASQVAAGAFLAAVWEAPADARLDPAILRQAVARANDAVLAMARADPLLEGMGTTLSAVVLARARGTIIHVGDSRVYHFGRGWVQQLTEDHTLATDLVARRYLSEEGAMRFHLRNALSRAVGIKPTVEADLIDLAVAPGEGLLLATDGLMKVLPPQGFLEATLAQAEGTDAQALCRMIIATALARDPDDNITAVVVRVLDGD